MGALKMTAIILAGGKSSRFGRDKAFVKIEGIPIIKKQINILAGIFKKIIIVTNSPRKYRLRGVKIIRDIIPDKGPLGGLYSGLKASLSFYNFVVACDMPFLNIFVIRYLMKKKVSFDVVLPRINKKYHPLFGIYSKDCIPAIEELLVQGKLKVSSLFSRVKVHFISRREIKRFDPQFLSLVNINTREDYRVYPRTSP